VAVGVEMVDVPDDIHETSSTQNEVGRTASFDPRNTS
jgi:hypothetical protein